MHEFIKKNFLEYTGTLGGAFESLVIVHNSDYFDRYFEAVLSRNFLLLFFNSDSLSKTRPWIRAPR